METNSVLSTMRNASTLLKNVDNELYRPKDDSVTLCTCQLTKNAVMGFLKSYLAQHKVEPYSSSLENLLSECYRIDRSFNNIQLSSFDCEGDDTGGGYCLDGNKVSECFSQAKLIEAFVLSKMKISKEELNIS